jgi:hypothetical protein
MKTWFCRRDLKMLGLYRTGKQREVKDDLIVLIVYVRDPKILPQ